MTGENTYPAVAFNFAVKFNGGGISEEAGFKSVSGLNAELKTQEVKVGGGGQSFYRLPQYVQYNNLILKRGIIKSSTLRKWVTDAIFHFKITPITCLLYTSPSPRDKRQSRMPSSA